MADRLVVANAKAGKAAGGDLEAVLDVLRTDGRVEVVHPEGSDELDRALADRGQREIVVAGGDGSLHHVVAALHRRSELSTAVLGLIPMGTGNDFARSVGISLDPASAARMAISCPPRRLDLITDDAGGVVVNAVHLGVGALAGDLATDLKPRLGPWAYVTGAIRAGVRARGWRVRVRADDRVLVDVRTKVLLVGLGNGATVGGGVPFAPAARVDDGRVDVVISAAVGPVARIAFAVGARLGRHGAREDVTMVRASGVRFDGEPIPINTDGEIGEPITSRSWDVRPEAWNLRAPSAEVIGDSSATAGA